MVVGAARCMLKAKGLPGWFWGEAVATAVYLLNRVPCKAIEGKTPFELWYERKPGMHHLKVFGCIVLLSAKTHRWVLTGNTRAGRLRASIRQPCSSRAP
jgi:hypothetical protein